MAGQQEARTRQGNERQGQQIRQRRDVDKVLHDAQALAGKHLHHQDETGHEQALLPGLGQNTREGGRGQHALQEREQRAGACDQGEGTNDPGADPGKEAPEGGGPIRLARTSQGLIGPQIHAPIAGKEPCKLPDGNEAGHEEEQRPR